ncbi:MAG: tetratricopeptide repeat protein [Clostridia bacterium]|nr:tetratricopeptide repeat protein [Clostridia bacterium]
MALAKAEGAVTWDWNINNRSTVIDFYKRVIENDNVTPKTPLPYYEVMDNLIAEHRTKEAREYFEIYKTLPAHKPALVPVYEAAFALAEFDVAKADAIMADAEKQFGTNCDFVFEYAQYHARKCEYKEAIECYERAWEMEKKPRFTDALHGIAIIYEILGDTEKATQTYDRMITCCKDEWGYCDDDAAIVEIERDKKRLMK